MKLTFLDSSRQDFRHFFIVFGNDIISYDIISCDVISNLHILLNLG